MVSFNVEYSLPALDQIIVKNEPRNTEFDQFTETLTSEYEAILKRLESDHTIIQKNEPRSKKVNPAKSDAEEESALDKNKKKKVQPKGYYYSPSSGSASYTDHFYTPGGIDVVRVPQNILGPNVLGRAFIGTNRIEILESLSGLAFEEVKRHEINHILNPYMGEMEIRQKTKAELPWDAYYH